MDEDEYFKKFLNEFLGDFRYDLCYSYSCEARDCCECRSFYDYLEECKDNGYYEYFKEYCKRKEH